MPAAMCGLAIPYRTAALGIHGQRYTPKAFRWAPNFRSTPIPQDRPGQARQPGRRALLWSGAAKAGRQFGRCLRAAL